MNDVLAQIGKTRLVPVIVLDRAEDAVPLGEALLAGGLPVAEVTFRTAAASDCIRAMSRLPVGAGTVLDIDTVSSKSVSVFSSPFRLDAYPRRR